MVSDWLNCLYYRISFYWSSLYMLVLYCLYICKCIMHMLYTNFNTNLVNYFVRLFLSDLIHFMWKQNTMILTKKLIKWWVFFLQTSLSGLCCSWYVFDIIHITTNLNTKWPVIVERYINDCEKWFKTLPIVSRHLLYIMYTESESKTKGKQGPFSFIFTS